MQKDWQSAVLASVAGAALGLLYLRRGWVPHDEGALAQSAERWLAGELPHRDFDEIYTGGLSAVHALAFRVLGDNLWSMRLVLFAVFAAFLPTVFYVCRRFVGPGAAALATVVAAAWSLPNYSAPIPSWYNLFFAVFGTAALLRHIETGRRRWLVAAGVAGGLSCLAKITGIYFIAAALVSLVYRESATRVRDTIERRDSDAYTVFTCLGVGLLAVMFVGLVRMRAGVAGIANFTAPIAILSMALVGRLWRMRGGATRERFASLGALIWPFVLGAAVPVAVFLIPYVASGSLGALWHGVFVLPGKRFAYASMGLLPPWTMRYGAMLAVLLWWARRFSARARRWLAILVGAMLFWLLMNARHPRPYEIVWYVARAALPIAVIGGALLLASRRAAVDEQRAQQLIVLLSVTACCALVQFPFAAPIYFLYVAPLALLAVIAVSATWDPSPQPVRTALLAFSLLFALLWINTGFIYAMGINHVRDRQTHLLELPRGGLRVTVEDKSAYERTIALVRQHAPGDYIWAGPDAPEVYFLAGKRNPTRTLFDFFDDPATRVSGVLSATDRHHVNVVVLHNQPPFSGFAPTALRDSLSRRFPNVERAGWFEIRWR